MVFMDRQDLTNDLAFVLFSQDSPAPTWAKKSAWRRNSRVKQEYLCLASTIMQSAVIERIRAEALASAAAMWESTIRELSKAGVSDRDILDGGVRNVLALVAGSSANERMRP